MSHAVKKKDVFFNAISNIHGRQMDGVKQEDQLHPAYSKGSLFGLHKKYSPNITQTLSTPAKLFQSGLSEEVGLARVAPVKGKKK